MVLVHGEVTVFEARGQFQIIVRKVELQGRGHFRPSLNS